jgi:hypothetical protein
MVATTHQPIFLPWPGFFHKALRADVLVLLDQVQFPQGRSWMYRNRLKSDQGDHWLRVPIRRAGRGRQMVADVEIYDETNWRGRHVRSLRELYAHAPYIRAHLPALEDIYARGQRTLVAFNVDLIRYLWRVLEIPGTLRLQSELGVTGRGTDLLANVCHAVNAETYVALAVARKYLEPETLTARGIELVLVKFHPLIYPQLWGDFRYNLSMLDVLLNCGPKARDLIARVHTPVPDRSAS